MNEKVYINELVKLLRGLVKDQRKNIDEAAGIIARSMMNDGVIHVFGTGHSSLVAQEAFMRA
ncbi:MAG: SIS domain-containing protein, partial [Candidatus Lindowbacteria bacterium]|nr:SIS domain-containing protein [Candidatus Lindowbacteria bacterium]